MSKYRRISYNSGTGVSFESKKVNSTNVVKHCSDYSYICPSCGKIVRISAKIRAALYPIANSCSCEYNRDLPNISVVPSNGFTVTCSCGSEMIATDFNIAVFVRDLEEKFGFEKIAIQDPFSYNGTSLEPNEINFMDSMKYANMQLLLDSIVNISTSCGYHNVYVALVNDNANLEVPINIEDSRMNAILELPDTYITIREIPDIDCIQARTKASEFWSYLETLVSIMSGYRPEQNTTHF